MIPYISEKDVLKLIDEKTAFRLAKETFLLMGRKQTVMPSKTYLNVPGSNDFRAMPAYVGGKKPACGVKWISVFPENRKKRLPTVSGTILLNSHETGQILAILEANALTALRTAAAAALASTYLSNARPRKLALVGAGIQAEYQLKALLSVYKFDQISVWGFLPQEAASFSFKFKKQFKNIRPEISVKKCVQDADIIVTCTPSRKPLVLSQWVKNGAHINAIGADAKGKEELDPRLLLRSKVVVDEWEQASHSGEINVPVTRGIFTKRHLHAGLSDIVSGVKPGRTAKTETTVFDSTGLAILDIYFAGHVYRHF